MRLQRIWIGLVVAGIAFLVLALIPGCRSSLGTLFMLAMLICFLIAAILGIAAFFIGVTLVVIEFVQRRKNSN
jgi:uncharacterized protein (DUF2062 family)